MFVKMVYVFVFIVLSSVFCLCGYEYYDEYNIPPYAPPFNIAMDFSICITIYISYSVLLLYKFNILGVAGIVVALLIHFLFLRSEEKRKSFTNWCVPTYGGWALIYIALYLFVNH